MNEEIERIIIDEGYFTEVNCALLIKPIFSTSGSFFEISRGGGIQITFVHDDSIRDLSVFKPVVIFEEYSLSDVRVFILFFDNIFLETEIAHGMIFKGEGTGIMRNLTMDLDPGYKNKEKFRGGVH